LPVGSFSLRRFRYLEAFCMIVQRHDKPAPTFLCFRRCNASCPQPPSKTRILCSGWRVPVSSDRACAEREREVGDRLSFGVYPGRLPSLRSGCSSLLVLRRTGCPTSGRCSAQPIVQKRSSCNSDSTSHALAHTFAPPPFPPNTFAHPHLTDPTYASISFFFFDPDFGLQTEPEAPVLFA